MGIEENRRILKETTAAARLAVGTCVAAIGGLAAAGMIEVDTAVVSPGEVVPSALARPASHYEGGVVEEILVSEGQSVSAGQPLVKLSKARSGASLGELEARRAALAGQVARLRAETSGPAESGGAAMEWPAEVTAEVRIREGAVLTERLRVLRSQVASLRSEISSHRASLDAYAAQESALEEKLALAQQAVNVGTGRRDLVDAKTALAETRRQKAGLPDTIRSLERRIESVQADSRAKASEELSRTEAELASVMAQVTAASDAVRRTEIVSPVGGVVQSLSVRSPGQAVAPNAEVAVVVPTEGGLTFEAKIAPEDRGGLAGGMPALIRLSSFAGQNVAPLAGTVVDVSPDVIVDKSTGRTHYKVRIHAADSSVGGEPVRVGMQGTGHILTGRRRVWDYVLGNLSDFAAAAFRDR